jgi:regulator of nucleoside diphosphate kinase
MRREGTMMMTRRRIFITEDDMARLRGLVHQGRMSSRKDQEHLAALDQELDQAEVIAAGEIMPDVVTMNSKIRVRDLDNGASMIYTLVFPVEADIERKRISVLAPIGTALLGFRAGDLVEWATPGGTKRLQIDEVLFQPEAAATSATGGRRATHWGGAARCDTHTRQLEAEPRR